MTKAARRRKANRKAKNEYWEEYDKFAIEVNKKIDAGMDMAEAIKNTHTKRRNYDE